jgi:hypothetical protein
MRLSMLVRLAAVCTLLGFVALCTPAQEQSQNTDDVAAAARKARAKQKEEPKPGKVFTNDDFPSSTPAPAAPATTDAKGEGVPDAAKATGQGKEKNPEDDPKSEAYWRKRFASVRNKLGKAEKELDVLQRELETDQVQYYSDPQKALMQQHDRSDINEKTAKVDAKKQEIAALKQQLSDMEDEVRKAGGDPGWAR